MLSKIRSQPWWFLPAIAFVIGLLIGWLVIGWGVWPVTYKNSQPPDLRAAERQDYLMMTAESFAATGDLNAAITRLSTWPPTQLTSDLGDLQFRLESVDPLKASQVQLMRGAVEANSPEMFGELASAPAIETETGTPSSLSKLMSTVLGVMLALGGILAIYYLFRRWRSANQQAVAEEPEPLPGAVSTVRRPGQAPFPEMEHDYSSAQTQAPGVAVVAPEAQETSESYDDETEEESDEDDEAPARADVATTGAPEPSDGSEGVRRFPRPGATVVAAQSGVTATAASVAGMTREGEYRSLYQMGESDYDEAFDIHDTGRVYVGQCGVELVDPIGRTHDQAAALQVWLWDTNDPDTKVKVLMSEGAYRDASLRSQLAGEHTVLPVRAGTEFELVSYNLLLKGVVERIDYAEQEPMGGVFAELGLRLAVYMRER